MKTISKIGFVASLCVLGFGASAQIINDFYHINGYPADHGQGDKVITTAVSEINPVATYVTAGVTVSPSGLGSMPTVSLSRYDLSGVNMWHKTFIVNSPMSFNTVAVKGLAEASNPSNSGFGILAFTNAVPQQSVLLKTDAAGNLLWKTELGRESAADLSYDSDLDRFLVLQRFLAGTPTGTSPDLELIVVDAKTGVILSRHNYDGFQSSADEPASVLYDAQHKSYLLTGTSTVKSIIGNQTQIMLARTTNTGALTYIRLIGYFGIAHTAVSATLIPSGPAGVNTEIAIGGLVTGVISSTFYSKQPTYTTVDVQTGSIVEVHVIKTNFDLRSISYMESTSSLSIVGNTPFISGNPLAGTAANLFQIDPTDPLLIGSIHVYNNAFSNFEFSDIRVGAMDQFVMVGKHLLPIAWAGSAANLNYAWLTTADMYGAGSCDNSDRMEVFAFPAPAMANYFQGIPQFLPSKVKVEEIAQSESMLDGCELPFRLSNTQPVASSEFRVFPNPATSAVTVEYTVADNDNADLNLMDISGRVILSQKLVSGDHATTTLNVADLASGIYYSDLRVNGQSVKKDKLVVQH
jgi:hypothetical protein